MREHARYVNIYVPMDEFMQVRRQLSVAGSLSFFPTLGYKNQTQVIGLYGKHFDLLKTPHWPPFLLLS